MNKRSTLFIFMYLLILNNITGYSYQVQEPNIQDQTTSNFIIPLEQIYLHLNTTFFLPGESMYYKAYTINAQTKRRSTLSKILYVVLINEDLKPVFTHKLLLKNGEGQGDYFIPSQLPSGNYKLVAYTQLTNHKGIEYAYQQDITIINPYQSNQTAVLPSTDTLSSTLLTKDKVKNNRDKDLYADRTDTKSLPFSLQLLDSIFDKRSLVTLQLRSTAADIQQGLYSISVRKIDTFSTVKRKTFRTLQSKYESQARQVDWRTTNTLPELRGELYKVNLKAKADTNKENYDEVVAISIPGEAYETKLLKPDTNGFFWFQRDTYDTRQDHMYLQVLGQNRDQYNVEITPTSGFETHYDDLNFTPFYLHPEMKEVLIDRSVKNQISNSFLAVKQDTIKVSPNESSPLESMYSQSYVLDAYNRFPSVSETVIEFIQGLYIGRDTLGNKVFRIRMGDEEVITKKSELPLVIVDGLVLQDHELLIAYPAAKIEAVHVIRKKYILGVKTFPGVLEVTTFDGDFLNTVFKSYLHKKPLVHPLEPKRYFRQNYTDTLADINRRIPDFRRQLLWEPNLILNDTATTVLFYTSDLTGQYELVLEGFTESGKSIRMTRRFRVQ